MSCGHSAEEHRQAIRSRLTEQERGQSDMDALTIIEFGRQIEAWQEESASS